MLLSWNWKLGAKDFDVQISQRPDFATTIEDVTTDNTSYAPLLQHFFYVNGGSFYWRVAARDKNFNVGDWTQPQRIDISQRLEVAVNPSSPPVESRPRHRVGSNGEGCRRRVRRVTGAGMRPKSGRTNGRGKVTLRVRRKKGGLILQRDEAGIRRRRLSMRVW